MVAEMVQPIPLSRRVAYLTVLTGLLSKGQRPFFEVTTLNDILARKIRTMVLQNLEISSSDDEMSESLWQTED
jgi:hypothetical protein